MTEAKKIGVKVAETEPREFPQEPQHFYAEKSAFSVKVETAQPPKSKSRRLVDPEIKAMTDIDAILARILNDADLDGDAAVGRILRWEWDRYIGTEHPGMAKQEAKP